MTDRAIILALVGAAGLSAGVSFGQTDGRVALDRSLLVRSSGSPEPMYIAATGERVVYPGRSASRASSFDVWVNENTEFCADLQTQDTPAPAFLLVADDPLNPSDEPENFAVGMIGHMPFETQVDLLTVGLVTSIKGPNPVFDVDQNETYDPSVDGNNLVVTFYEGWKHPNLADSTLAVPAIQLVIPDLPGAFEDNLAGETTTWIITREVAFEDPMNPGTFVPQVLEFGDLNGVPETGTTYFPADIDPRLTGTYIPTDLDDSGSIGQFETAVVYRDDDPDLFDGVDAGTDEDHNWGVEIWFEQPGVDPLNNPDSGYQDQGLVLAAPAYRTGPGALTDYGQRLGELLNGALPDLEPGETTPGLQATDVTLPGPRGLVDQFALFDREFETFEFNRSLDFDGDGFLDYGFRLLDDAFFGGYELNFDGDLLNGECPDDPNPPASFYFGIRGPASVSNEPPVIAGGLVLTPSSATLGETVSAMAIGVADNDGEVLFVSFYLDADGDSIPEPGELFGFVSADDARAVPLNPEADLDTNMCPLGTGQIRWCPTGDTTVIVEVTDDLGATTTASAVLNITGNVPPVITSFTLAPDPVTQGETVTATVTVDDNSGIFAIGIVHDTNGNGLADGGEPAVGSAASPALGLNEIPIDSSGLPAGSVSLVAVVLDDESSGTSAAASVTVESADCPADLDPPGNPDGQLGFFDLVQYLTLFANQDPKADLDPVGAPDGQFGFFDLVQYLTLFALGCP